MLRVIKDKCQHNLAILRSVNGKEYTYAKIAHKLGITLDIVKNVVRTLIKDSLIPEENKNSTKITEEYLVDIKLMVANLHHQHSNLTNSLSGEGDALDYISEDKEVYEYATKLIDEHYKS